MYDATKPTPLMSFFWKGNSRPPPSPLLLHADDGDTHTPTHTRTHAHAATAVHEYGPLYEYVHVHVHEYRDETRIGAPHTRTHSSASVRKSNEPYVQRRVHTLARQR